MRGLKILLVFLSAMLLVAPAFSQGTNATVTGTIADSTGALIPGVSVTATNTATGVVNTVITNETGSYNFPSSVAGHVQSERGAVRLSDSVLHECASG